MSLIKESCSVVSSLVPMYSTGNKTEKSEGVLTEEQMCAVALLISATILGVITAMDQKNYKAFDANPGDGACQNQALELRRLFQLDLREESQNLKKVARKLSSLVQRRKSNRKERRRVTTEAFFSEHVDSVRVTKEMEYLLHCYLLTVTRVPYKTLENGVVLTRTDSSRLVRLSKRLNNVKQIASRAQVDLSMLNMETIRSQAEQLSTVENQQCLIEMLSKEKTHLYSPHSMYAKKAYGSLFYCVKTVIHRLREVEALVALKSIVKEGKPFHLLMKPSKAGHPFEIIPDSAYSTLTSETPLVVFEAVVEKERSEVVEAVRKRGFTDLVLTSAAKAPPFEPGSTLASVKLSKALEEITAFKAKTCCIELDHIYLNTIKAEGVNNATT